jgi:HK97 family phage major capsid protein/HK97 family phage prohead protease
MTDLVYRAAVQSTADPYDYVMSDETVDRMGDVVQADGWDLASFKSNPIGLLNHRADAIIGRWENVRVEGKRLLARFVFAEEGTSKTVDEARSLWRQKILRGASVGFRELKKEVLHKDADPYAGPFRYVQQQLLECSLVSVPANANAMPLLRSYHLVPEISRQIFGKTASQDRPDSRVTAQSLSKGSTKMKTPLTKQIENQQSELNRLRDQLNSLITAEDRDEDQESLAEALPDMIAEATKQLEKMQSWERALALRTAAEPQEDTGSKQEVAVVDNKRPFALPKKKIEPADYVFRAAAASLRAFSHGMSVDQVIRENYGNDEATQIITRAAVNPATTTTAGYASELVQVGWGAFLDRLLAQSVYGPLSAAGTRYDLGRNGTLKVPYRASTPQASGAWVGEGNPKPVKNIGLSTVTLTPHKLSCITVYTEEMAMSSVPAIEGILRKAMVDDTQASLDGYLIDAVAESAIRPAGLLVGVTPITASVLTTSLDKIVADINALIAPIEAAGGGGNIVLLMNPAQARKINMAATTTGQFAFGGPGEAASKFGANRIIESTTITAGRVIAVDADWFATATGDMPRFAVSNEATLHMEDTTPLALGVAGSPNTVAAPMRSLYQTDSIGIRLSLYVTWAMVRTAMVQTIAAVTW